MDALAGEVLCLGGEKAEEGEKVGDDMGVPQVSGSGRKRRQRLAWRGRDVGRIAGPHGRGWLALGRGSS